MNPNDPTSVLISVVIPVASILVPTIIAVALARGERLAANADRKREAEVRLAERHHDGIVLATEGMLGLLGGALESNGDERRRIILAAQSRLAVVGLKLDDFDGSFVSVWIMEEYTVVANAINVRDAAGRPVHLTKVMARQVWFSLRLTEWLAGERDWRWFEKATHEPIENTPEATPDSMEAAQRV